MGDCLTQLRRRAIERHYAAVLCGQRGCWRLQRLQRRVSP